MEGTDKQFGFLTFGILALIIIAFIGLNSFGIVGPGERGVLVNLGQVQAGNLGEGIHFKAPFIQGIAIMDVKTQKIEGAAAAASKDLQVVSTNVALNYRLRSDQTYILYQEIGIDYVSRIIDPAIQESVKAATAKFTAEELITKRELVKQAIEDTLRIRLSAYFVEVQSLSITDFDFSEGFNAAIEAKVTAEQDALRAERKLQEIKVVKQQTITQAEAQNEKVKLEADAEAYKVLKEAEAEAKALKLIREQLELNTQLIDYKAIEKWDGTVPKIVGSSGATLFDVTGIIGSD